MEDAKHLYLDLMKRALTYLIYGQEEFKPAQRPRDLVRRLIFDALIKRDIVPMRHLPVNLENRIEGRDWPAVGLTMIGMKRLNQLQECVEDVCLHITSPEISLRQEPGEVVPPSSCAHS